MPAAQGVHTRSTVSEGVFDTYVPAGQVCQLVQLEAPAAENEPAAHAAQLPAFVADEAVPASHGAHVRSTLADGVFETYVPAPQLDQLPHEPAFVAVVNVPAAHAVHARSNVAVGVFDTYVPAAQVDHALHAAAPAPEYDPAAHELHEPEFVEPA